MSLLRICDQMWGADTIFDADPFEEVHYNAVVNPFDPALWLNGPDWGVFREDGQLIDAAAYFRLPEKFRVGQQSSTTISGRAIENAPDGDYIYCGPVILHYGHFVTAFVSRLWPIVRGGVSPTTRFVCHCNVDPEDWFGHDYARRILGALGLEPRHFIRPLRMTRFRSLRIPRPAFEEQNFAHRVFQQLCEWIGVVIKPEGRLRGPVYISKTLLRPATQKLGNEAAIEDVFAARGIDIVYPERLSFHQQVSIISSASVVVGTVGSAFHTALFSPSRTRMIGLTYGDRVNANLVLVDRLTGSDSVYLYPAAGLSTKPLTGTTFGYWLDDPESVANELLSRI